MTRETKIGLLVGLAFIIVIGVLLSDHLTTRGELTKAELTQVGETVRTGTAVPSNGAPPIPPVTIPTNVVPVARVQTSEELNQRPATAIVQVGPGPIQSPAAQGLVSIPTATGADATAPGQYTPAAGVQEPTVLTAPIRQQPEGTYGQSLIAVAGTAGNPADDMKPVAPNQPLQVAANPSLKPIKAEKGDTVSRWASKYLGSNTSANRQAIIDANPSLKANPAMVVLGNTYMMPEKPAAAAADPAASQAPAIPGTTPVAGLTLDARRVEELMNRPQTQQPEKVAAETKKPAGTTTYTVKANDTLWDIASRLGDPGLVKEIQNLNKDVLKKGVLKPGMTLKIPARTAVASR